MRQETVKKMAIIGAGAIGTLVGGYISMGGEDITLIAPYWREHVEALRQRGLKIDGCRGERLVKVKALHIDELDQLGGKIDILFIAVKAYDTERMFTLMKPYLNKNAWVVSLQNGIMEDVIIPIAGEVNTIGCSTMLGVSLWEPGHVTQEGKPDVLLFTIGELDGKITPRIKELARVLELCGPTKITNNIWGQLWAKLLLNCMVNTMEGITGHTTDELYKNEQTRHLLKLIAAEVVQVAEALGYKMEPVLGIGPELWKKAAQSQVPEVDQAMFEHGRTYKGGHASMLQDIIKGRRTEIDELNGYVIKRGRETGILTPVNEAVLILLKKVESGKLKHNPVNIDTLLGLLPY
ncbi:ketopantoate reductase family protein [Chloroflexota bacterium]